MNVQEIMEQAVLCKTDDDAQALLDALVTAFCDSGPISHLPQYNAEAYMEDDKPFVRFELNRLISDYYVTMIRPEIRDGAMVVVVVTNHMKDGLGTQSQKWEVVEGFDEEVIEATLDQSIDDLASRAKDLALADHRMLIEQVGVPQEAAKEAALKSW